MMNCTKALQTAACILSLMGCQTTARDEYGTSALTISSGLQDAFNEYLKLGEPRLFMVSEDGRAYGYASCHSQRCKTEQDFFLAQSMCLRMSEGVPCRVYASGDRIVWAPDAIRPAAPDMPRTVHMPEDGMLLPWRRWNGGRIDG